jgi:hypothetical protein
MIALSSDKVSEVKVSTFLRAEWACRASGYDAKDQSHRMRLQLQHK